MKAKPNLLVLLLFSLLFAQNGFTNESNSAELSSSSEMQLVDRKCKDSTRLLRAISNNNLARVKRLTTGPFKVDVNIEVCNGSIALMYAAGFNRTEIAKHLIEVGAKIDAQNKDGDTALMWAAGKDQWRRGSPEIVKLLVEAGANLDIQNKYGGTALFRAIHHGYAKSAKLLIEAGAGHISTALLIAAGEVGLNRINTRIEMVKLLIAAGANLDIQNKDGLTPLMRAARWPGGYGIVKQLIEAGANLDIKNKYGGTPLMLAIEEDVLRREKTKTVKLLIEAGAGVDIQDNQGRTALMWALGENIWRDEKTKEVKLLIEAGARVDVQDKDGFTALIRALRDKKTKSAKLLIEGGSKPYLVKDNELVRHVDSGYDEQFFAYRNAQGENHLLVATKEGNLSALKWLIDFGFDFESKNAAGESALVYASRLKELYMFDYLLDLGADINSQDKAGRTMLMKEALAGSLERVTWLLELGIDKKLVDNEGRTAYNLVLEAGFEELADFILNFGTNPDPGNDDDDGDQEQN